LIEIIDNLKAIVIYYVKDSYLILKNKYKITEQSSFEYFCKYEDIKFKSYF